MCVELLDEIIYCFACTATLRQFVFILRDFSKYTFKANRIMFAVLCAVLKACTIISLLDIKLFSPYLYILVLELLSVYRTEEYRREPLHNIAISSQDPRRKPHLRYRFRLAKRYHPRPRTPTHTTLKRRVWKRQPHRAMREVSRPRLKRARNRWRTCRRCDERVEGPREGISMIREGFAWCEGGASGPCFLYPSIYETSSSVIITRREFSGAARGNGSGA